jgi:hypothetical protein
MTADVPGSVHAVTSCRWTGCIRASAPSRYIRRARGAFGRAKCTASGPDVPRQGLSSDGGL